MRRFVKLAAAVLFAAGVGAFVANATSTPAKPPVPAVETASLLPSNYELSLDNGFLAVSGGPGGTGCETRLLAPITLRLVRSIGSCASANRLSDTPLVVDFKPAGDEIHVAATNGTGPLLLTIDNWSWAHSGVTSGNGAVWIFGLGTKTLLEASTTTGQVIHRWTVGAGADPWMAVDADGFWMTQGVWDGSFCGKKCTLWHVAPGSDQLVAVRQLTAGSQWFVASGHSLYVDELTGKPGGMTQSIWRLDGPTRGSPTRPGPRFCRRQTLVGPDTRSKGIRSSDSSPCPSLETATRPSGWVTAIRQHRFGSCGSTR